MIKHFIRHAPLWIIAAGLSVTAIYLIATMPLEFLRAMIIVAVIWPTGYGLIRSWEWAARKEV